MAEKYITQTALQRFFTGLKSKFSLVSHTHGCITDISAWGAEIHCSKDNGNNQVVKVQESLATIVSDGLMSSSDKKKLDGLADQTLITNAEIDGVCV